MDYELIAPCHFGLESVLKREVQALGYTITKVEDGKVRFLTDEAGIARANTPCGLKCTGGRIRMRAGL